MQQVFAVIEQHSLFLLFLSNLVARGGLPLPIVPILIAAGALAAEKPDQIIQIILVSLGGSLLAELGLYWLGLRYGQRFVVLLCKMSFSPDFCVRQTETVFTKLGLWSLVFAKFLPGLSLISVAMAGIANMSFFEFFLLNGLGGLLFVGAFVMLGVIFQDAITSALATLIELGALGILMIVAALGLYLLLKWWRRRLFIRQLRMDRITVSELRQLIDDGQKIVILDVRPQHVRMQDGIIPGAISAHPADIDPIIKSYSRDVEIIVYCACPNEESAATAAKHLKQAGFKKIRPLLGGIDAWAQAGHPIERIELIKKAA
ncbi:MAG TPA: rhodanese-like domain-containing protein [Pseudolabrys sp.]|jgi:membrane protein DedA with SNARE-associated domain/rhodanese-related sulfurtransferase|nr:rhodanese-like domain-containing protein [Pseudolabrys sp.]